MAERVLWRLETSQPHRAELLVLTETRPSWEHIVEQAGWPGSDQPQAMVRDYQPLLDRLQHGREFAFRLRANPVTATRTPTKPSARQKEHLAQERPRGVRVPHRTAVHQLTWLPGPGTRITSAAVRLLADSGTAVCWVGDRGVRMYAAGLGPSRGSGLLLRQAYLVTRTRERLDVARRMYAKRFPDDDVTTATMQQLRGREGARVKKIYRTHSERTGVTWTRRVYAPGDPFAAGDDINRLLSAGHSCLYGICHAAIVGIGASPALGFVHTGTATSFVLDIADLYKADYTIPLAFDLAAAGHVEERDIRTAFRDKVADGHLMARIVHDIKDLLLDGSDTSDPDEDSLHLWDEIDGHVPGGVNWAADVADQWDDTTTVGVTGPDTDTEAPPW